MKRLFQEGNQMIPSGRQENTNMDRLELTARRCLFYGFVGAFVFSCASVCAQSSRYEEFIESGVKASQKGDYAGSEKMFAAALAEALKSGERDPRVDSAYDNLAWAYARQKKYAQAETIYKKLLADGKGDPIKLAELYVEMGRPADAVPLYKQAIASEDLKAMGWAPGANRPTIKNKLLLMNTCAPLLRKLGRESEAAEMEKEAQKLTQGVKGKK